MFGFSNWILSSPDALGIVLIMGHIVSFILFLALAVISWIYFGWIPRIITTAVFLITLRNLSKYILIKLKGEGGITTTSMNDMIYNKDVKEAKENEFDHQPNKESE